MLTKDSSVFYYSFKFFGTLIMHMSSYSRQNNSTENFMGICRKKSPKVQSIITHEPMIEYRRVDIKRCILKLLF